MVTVDYEKRFETFLIKEFAHLKFAINMINLEKSNIEELFNREKKPERYFIAGFKWSASTEGVVFWSKLNSKWLNVLKEDGVFLSNVNFAPNAKEDKVVREDRCSCKNPKTLETTAYGDSFKVCAGSKGGCGKEIEDNSDKLLSGFKEMMKNKESWF